MCLSGTSCSGACVQLATDGANCGRCGLACGAGDVCSGGHCAPSCAAPLAECGEGAQAHCADLRSDPTSCGSCGRACADGQLCAAGTCVETCGAPLTTCNDGTSSSCVDLRFDPAHCGDCDSGCGTDQVCSAGQCRSACSEPLSACGTGASSRCIDLRNDPANCGGCGIACPTGQVCNTGVCGPGCAAPLAVCGVGDDARCVDLRSDVSSCGTCDHACAVGEACLAGSCIATCEGAGGTICDGTCVDVTSDDAHCGECGHACSAGTRCHASLCEVTCPAGQIPCGGACLDASDDPQNCGACGNVCTTGICRAGECAAPTCDGTIGLPGRPMAPPSLLFDQPVDRALVDLDGDGVLDLVIPRRSGGVVEIRYVRAPGVFSAPINVAVAGKPDGIASGDVDGDGRADLVACSSEGAGAITTLLNRGDGTFERSDSPGNGAAYNCELGDLDGDHRPDLVLSYVIDGQIAVARNTGSGFATPVVYPARRAPKSIVLSDLDRDGKLDVLVAHAPNSTSVGDHDIDGGSVSVYPGRGDGTLDSPATYATGRFPFDLVVADLDGDGWPDVAAAALIDRAVAILRNDGHGALLPRVSIPMDDGPVSLAAGDLDGDGSVDLVVNRSYNDVAVLHNDGHAAFALAEVYAISSQELALADANRDGALDLYDATARAQLILQEAGHLVAPRPIEVEGERVVLIDVDRDGHLDAVAATGLNGPVAILRGRASGGFEPPALLAGSGADVLAIGDVDGDGDLDLVYGWSHVFLRRNEGDGTFGPEELIQSEGPNPAPALGDLDGDGDLDLAVASGPREPSTVQVWWNDGGGHFQRGPELVTGLDSVTPVIGAVTGNGRPDLVVPGWLDGTLSVFRSHPDGSFTRYATLPVPLLTKSVLIADVTQDGVPDLVAAGPGDPFDPVDIVRIFPGVDHGLGAPIDVPAGVLARSLAVVDIDSDGRRDLVVIGANLAVHLALPGGGFAAPLIYPAAGAEGLAVHDLTGDLRPDVVTISSLSSGAFLTLVNRCYADP